jgi:hypothetical protein
MIKYISTQPLGNKRSLIIVSGDYLAASLSILFSNPGADYKYLDTDSGAAGYISSEDVFKFFVRKLQRRPSNSLFQNSKRLGATLSECIFLESAHNSKISRSTTWLLSRNHSNEACFYSARPRGTRRGFQDQPYSARGLVGT